ncbi:MAG: putative lipid II flippase FtsW [bacterium]|nr:putative lipid II flippase FtsW [bacterium]
MIKANEHKADYVLLIYFVILLCFGLLMLTSASAPLGYNKFGDKYFFIRRQLIVGVLPGIFLFLFFSKIYYKKLKKYSGMIFIFTLILSSLVFIPGIGSALNTSANSWIKIGSYSMQPAEFLKLGMIIFLAYYLCKTKDDIADFKTGFLPALGFGSIPLVLVVLQPDIGTASVLFVILFGVLFLGGSRLWHMVLLAGAGVGGFLLMIVVAPYRAARFMTFLNPELDQLGDGYQINQAYLAIGSGGLFGRGLWGSVRKYEFLPEVNADSIFAIIAEETGFLFTVAFIILMMLICLRGLRIAKNAPDEFSRLLVSGIIIWFVSQSFMNIAAMVGLMPLTGLPLPFISHGGTALLIALASVGILINISKYTTE